MPASHRHRYFTSLAVAAAVLLASPAAAAPRAARTRLAILDFPAAGNAFACSGWSSNEGRMAAVLRDLFTTEIGDQGDGKIRLIERERLADLRGELAYQQGQEVDPAAAQQLGKQLGARFVLTGKITRFACKKVEAASGWGVGALVGKLSGSDLAGKVAGSVGGKKANFSGRLDARLIDVQTGEILGTFKEENDASDISFSVAGGGVDVPYDDQIVSKVYEPAVQKMAGGIVKKALKAAKELDAEAAAADEDAEERPAKKRPASSGAGATGGAAGGQDEGADAGRGAKKAGGGGAVPQVYGNDFDFVPGEQQLFFDDFSDTEVGDYPARWRIASGGGARGQAEVAEAQGKRWFKQRVPEQGSQVDHQSTVRYQVKGDLPQKFTVEFDALSGEKANYSLQINDRVVLTLDGSRFTSVNGSMDSAAWKPVQVKHVAIAVNGTSIKLYVDGKRYLNDPEAFGRPVATVGMRLGSSYTNAYDGVMFTNFRLAEGGKDITQAIQTEGRIVTHGITFDSGSDRIRPESGPTLRKILKVLQDDGALSFEIQGHTDNQGGDKVNGPLSEKRAAAVKAWLASQGIEDGRLTTKGLGATKPLKPNDSAEGRAENRRVEFVKRS